jgi:hypothetical protein
MTERRRLANRRNLETFAIADRDGHRWKIGLGREIGSSEVLEVFVNAQKVNSTADVLASDGAILMSLLIQYGHPVAEIAKSMKRNPDGSPSSPLGRAAALINEASQQGERLMPQLTKSDPNSPALIVVGKRLVAIRAGTALDGSVFDSITPVEVQGELVAGADYGVAISAGGVPRAWRAQAAPLGEGAIGGFHFAPGGNAAANAGGEDIPAINPCSLWDLNFRPACPDPRGMALVEMGSRKFWCDIYLTGADHLTDGTSRFGTVIADHWDPPQNPEGGRFDRFDYAAARAVMAHHRKGLLGAEEFYAAAAGVAERTACERDPKITGLDAARTSRFGLMQATGNMWTWGHDGSMRPRASVFGGSWWHDGHAGSRYAALGCWPDYSSGSLGARGRSDHLQLA